MQEVNAMKKEVFEKKLLVYPLGANSFINLSDHEIQEIECILGEELPLDYKYLMREIGGFVFSEPVSVSMSGRIPPKYSKPMLDISYFLGS